VTLDAVHNFRDLGGYRSADGRVTRWGRLYRSDALYRVTDGDLEIMRRLGIRTVVDLRTRHEVDNRGTYPVDQHDVRFEHLPLIQEIWERTTPPADDVNPVDYLVDRYLEMLDNGDMIAAVFDVLAHPEALPAVFHCAAGKDRTGVLAMLVLSVLGVADDDIAADYALTAEAMGRMRAYFKAHPEVYGNIMEDPPEAYMASPADVVHQLLGRIRADHGLVEGFLASVGVSVDVLAHLRSQLLE
jgi:protein-tyrosine phosphatase